ncbi:AT-rich interactive domain-containing protein 1A-like [Pectinophora gossypiella]|uniref:AT-rich interactive domain-containing protein 1A-like n=1 Tax=Pectinophora gossypiella TaxID=13191 RepID=UPI00214F1254|nr:AT-rich interactive domain-containing protein 1A-like [Pectinophora gossypiella]
MNLIVIAAVIAVCGAAKLDRTYLPPASAKTAGGSPGSLQTPFSGNSFNNGLGGLPKGSFENDFQGVVVDAAVAGTRGSESFGTGLGAPRISYGSTNSKVGDAAFKTGPAAFRQPDSDGQTANYQGSQQSSASNFQGSLEPSGPERPRAALDRAASILRYESEVGPENFHYAFETDNGIIAEENGVATNGIQAQGGFSYTGDDGQVYSVSYTADEGGYQPKGDHLPTPPPIPEEILKSLEQNAREEAAGLVDDGSYDAQKYNVGSDYTENDSTNGKYTHQSSKFGGSDADATASGTFISQNNQQFEKLTGGQAAFNAQDGQGSSLTGQNGRPSLGNRFSGQAAFGSASDGALNEQSGQSANAGESGQDDKASAANQGSSSFSGQATFGSRFNSASKRPSSHVQSGPSSNGLSGQSTQINIDSDSDQSSFGQSGFGSSSASKGQSSSGLAGQSGQINAASGSNQGSSSAQGAFGFGSNGSKRPSFTSQSQQSQFIGQSTQEDAASGQFEQDNSGSAQGQINAFGSTSAQNGAFSQGSGFGNRNEYLPPINKPQNGRPQSNRPQANRPQGGNPQTSLVSADSSNQRGEEPTSEKAAGTFVPLGQQDLQNESRPQGSLTSFGKPAANAFSTESKFGSSNQNKPSNGRRPSPNSNGFAQGQSSQSGIGARPNEYLPPTSNNQNAKPQTQPQRPSKGASQFNQQYNAQASSSFQAPQGRPQSVSGPLPTESSFGSQAQQSNGFQRQPSRPVQNGNRFPSRFSATSAQSTSGFGLDAQKATSQPDTELTTPFETSNDGSISQANMQFGTSAFASSSSSPPGRPTQATFANQFNSQSTSGSQFSSRPQGPSSRPFGQAQTPVFPSQSSQGQFNQNAQFGQQQQQPQVSFAQNNDAQFSPSTPRPSYSQQPQGPDDSYYYNQPSKPFGIPQGSRFPSAPSNQFNRVTQQPSFSQSAQASSSFQSVPSTAIPVNQFQGSTRHPRPPTLAPTAASAQAQTQFSGNFQGSTRHPRPPTLAPTAPSASQFQGAINGVTQASISPFPSQTPTQATQFNAQAQFGSRPNFQQSQFSQTSQSNSPFSQKPTQPSFGQQPSTMPAFPQSFGGNNKFQSQSQASVNQKEPQTDDSEKPVASPQYSGEIYEYNKPAQTLPSPDSTPASSTGQKVQIQSQFGSQPSRPQFGQTSDEEDQRPASQFNVQSTAQVQGARPQFGGQPKPQFGQNTQSQSNFAAQSQQSTDDNKPFGALAQSQSTFGVQSPQQGSRPQFGAQPSRPQFGQTQNQNRFGAQSQSSQQPDDESPEPNAQPASQEPNAEPESPQGPKNQFGFVSPCCKPQPFGRRPQNQPQGSQNQFDQTSSAAQSFKPETSFSGKGEEFEASRQPPSFDEQTGYHY